MLHLHCNIDTEAVPGTATVSLTAVREDVLPLTFIPLCWSHNTWTFGISEMKKKKPWQMTLVSCCWPTGDRAHLLSCRSVTECVAPVAPTMTLYCCAVPACTTAATNLAGWQADRRLAGRFVLQAACKCKPISLSLTRKNCCQVHCFCCNNPLLWS